MEKEELDGKEISPRMLYVMMNSSYKTISCVLQGIQYEQ
jgi:hypothetical protein